MIGLCFGIMLGLYLCYQREKFREKRNKKRELALKGAATLTAALPAWYGFFRQPDPGFLLIAVGLCVCAAADVVLDLHFLAGTACFGLGHVCYCAAYVLLSPPGWPSALLFFLLCAGAGAAYPQLKKLDGPGGALPYLVYALVIAAMLALALPQKPALLAGAGLFVASDALLLVRIAYKVPSRGYDYLCLGCYYLAQFLIGASVLL